MAKPRKSLNVDSIVQNANALLASDYKGFTPDHRRGVILMVERVLQDSSRYLGFAYMTQNQVPPGVLPGVRVAPNGDPLSYEEQFRDTDDTRRQYFC